MWESDEATKQRGVAVVVAARNSAGEASGENNRLHVGHSPLHLQLQCASLSALPHIWCVSFRIFRAHTISVSFLSRKILVTQYSFLLSLFSGKRQINKNSAPAAAENSRPENAKAAASERKLSSEVPRSPTLPAEIRRSNVKAPPEESRREGPAIVARLMGLEAAPAPTDSVVEKRQKLLGALQRCDEDLKALKKIIEAVRLADPPRKSPSPAVASVCLDDKLRTVSEVKCSVVNGEQQQQQQQPSPVSVLDEFTRSPLSPSCPSGRHSFGKPPLNRRIHSHWAFSSF